MKWPQLRRVDLGVEFMGSVTKEMEKHKTNVRRGRTRIHRDQAMVKRYNRTLAKRLFGLQYGVEMQPPESQRYSEWVVRLPVLVSALSGEVTRLTGKKPVAAIKEKAVYSKPSTPYHRPVSVREKNGSLPIQLCAISTNPASLKAEGKEPQIRSGL